MTSSSNASLMGKRMSRLLGFAPGLSTLLSYQRADFPNDLLAGLSVAAVALPVGVAYAQLAGFDPVVGLYASMLPLVAYALFGTSRQLIVGPDAATCALVAAAVAPLAGGDPERYQSLSVVLASLVGLFCLSASFLRLGALADFLSKPILVGFLNGIALHILTGQFGKLFGFVIEAPGIVPKFLELVMNIKRTHGPTLPMVMHPAPLASSGLNHRARWPCVISRLFCRRASRDERPWIVQPRLDVAGQLGAMRSTGTANPFGPGRLSYTCIPSRSEYP